MCLFVHGRVCSSRLNRTADARTELIFNHSSSDCRAAWPPWDLFIKEQPCGIQSDGLLHYEPSGYIVPLDIWRQTGFLTTAPMSSCGFSALVSALSHETFFILIFCIPQGKNGIRKVHCVCNLCRAKHLGFPLAEPHRLCYHLEVNLWQNVSKAFQLLPWLAGHLRTRPAEQRCQFPR